MKKPGLLVSSSAIALAVVLVGAVDARAQTQPTPPQRYTLDERGVDLVTGQFNYATQEVVIGDPAQGGLSYGRVALNQGWRDLALGGVTCSASQCVVAYDGVSEVFNISGQTYVPVVENGATLVRNPGQFIHTSSDGTVATLTDRSEENPYEETSLLSTVVHPNGTIRQYNYKTSQFCDFGACPAGTAARLQSIQSNRGYQIHYEYEANSYDYRNPLFFKVKRVAGINTAVQYCDPLADSCPTTGENWPSVTYSEASDGPNGTFEFGTDQLDRQTRYHLDIQGQLDRVRLPGRQTDQVAVFRTNGQVTQAVGPTGSWAYGYDGDFNYVQNTSYGPQGEQTQVRAFRATLLPTEVYQRYDDGSGIGQTRSWLYEYDEKFQLTLVREPEQNSTALEYDARGNVTRITQRSKDQQQTIVSSATYPTDCANINICNKPQSTTDGRGNTTDYAYDPNHGGVTAVTRPAPKLGAVRPQVRVAYAPQSAWTLHGGPGYLQRPAVTLPVSTSTCATAVACAGMADEIVASTTYQAGSSSQGSNALAMSQARGSGNGSEQAVVAMTYNADSDVVTTDGPLPGTADTTRYLYDDLRRVVGMIGPDPDQGGPLLNRAMRVTYNADGSVGTQETGTTAGQTDAAWTGFQSLQQVVTIYDAYVRPADVRFQANGTIYNMTHIGYDGSGRTQCVTQRMNPAAFNVNPGPCVQGGGGPFGPDRITRTVYGPDDAVLSVTSGLGTVDEITERATYRSSGNPDTLTDGQGNVSAMDYDGFDRSAGIRYPDPATRQPSSTDYEQTTYDAASNPVSSRTRSGQIFMAAYDALNRPTAITAPAPLAGQAPADSVSYTYDNLDRLLSAAIPKSITSMTWDALGRQTSESGPLGTMAMHYDAAGRRTRLTWPDGFVVSYGYDLTDAMVSITQVSGDQLQEIATYAYDDLGRRTRLSRGNGVVTTYGYDPASRLAGLTHDIAGTASDQFYGYSHTPSNQIFQLSSSNPAYDFGVTAGVDGYVNDGLNRITAVNATGLSYDGNSNLINDGARQYGYDAANRLRSTSTNNGTIAYDALGRLREVTGTLGARYLSDGVEAAGIYPTGTSTTIQARFIRGPWADELVGTFQGAGSGTLNYFAQDHLGSNVAIAGPTGAIVGNPLAYDDYGLPRVGNGGRFMYTGQLWLPDFAVYHYKARAFHPGLGRFLQTDPIGYAAGANLYAYVANDPVNSTDPLGMQEEPTLPGVDVVASCAALGGRWVVLYGERRCVPNVTSLPPNIGGSGVGPSSGGPSGGNEAEQPACPPARSNPIGRYGQRYYALTNPARAAVLSVFQGQATAAARDRFPFTSQHNTLADAYRHFYFSYSAARVFGGRNSRLATDSHEVSVNGPIGEIRMDTYNNSVGRAFAADPRFRGLSAREAAERAVSMRCLQSAPT